jgi:RNA polymerase sigma-70 factor (ECF subfamily)
LQIARRLVIDQYRRHAVRGTPQRLDEWMVVAAEDAHGRAGTMDAPRRPTEEQALLREQAQILWQLLHQLPIEQKEMRVLRYMLGWKVTRIAEYMGCNENTVSVTIRRSLTRLSRHWPSPYDEEEV